MNTNTLLQEIAAATTELPVQYVFVDDSELVYVGGGGAATGCF